MKRNLTRTALLGSITTILGITWLANEFELDLDRLLEFLLSSTLIVLGCMMLAALVVVFRRVLRRKPRSAQNNQGRSVKNRVNLGK
jgi:drug/metabolite transporter (DMT)-like permease